MQPREVPGRGLGPPLSAGAVRTPVRAEVGWRWRESRTGLPLRMHTCAATAGAADRMGRTHPGPGRITMVVDTADDIHCAGARGAACRRFGRFVVHTSPGQQWAWRFQHEVLCALGKDWDRLAQGGDATLELLSRAWLRAERARDLIVLRAQHLAGPALEWTLGLAASEGLRLWLISPRPLPGLRAPAGIEQHRLDARDITGSLLATHRVDCDCEDLNDRAPTAVEVAPVAAGRSGTRRDPAASAASAADSPAGVAAMSATMSAAMSAAAARRLRLLYDLEGAALAAASLLLGRPTPEVLAVLNAYVDPSARTMATTTGRCVAIPEYARALLRGWAGHWLVPHYWAPDVAEPYWTLRLEEAQRHSQVEVLHPDTPALLPPTPWHERYDPGAQELAELTCSARACSLARRHALHEPARS